jgi:lysophospholipase L1-like esterase
MRYVSLQASRLILTALLGLASLHVAEAASRTDCLLQDERVPGQSADQASFDWDILPELPAAQTPGAYRIGLWGDSLTSAPVFIDAALQASGIDKSVVLPSFIQAGMNVSGLSLPLKLACASSGWKTAYAYKEKGATPAFSQGLLSMESSSPGDFIFMDFRFPLASTRVTQLDVLLEKAESDGSLLLSVSIDGQDDQLIPLSRRTGKVLRITPRAPMSTLRVRVVSGQVKIHGFRPRYQASPKVVLDTLSVPGGLMRGWAYVDQRLAAVIPSARDYDLILIQYGTNEGAAPNFNAARYADYLRANLARVRSFHPHARCILIGPPDRGVAAEHAADPLKYSAIHRQIATAQRQISAAYGCGFWDWQGETGGVGTAVRWARAKPPLMQPDLTHMTAQGYASSGQAFARFYSLSVSKH